MDFENLSPKNFILIKGAKVNNLKNIDVAIPRNKMVVITGLSGSGKSSLAFDTLYAEGQRIYVESISSYARQFLGRMEKPDVEYIKGISPAIAIEQRVNTKNPRSTVGTTTEIYDYLKLFYARIGHTFSPISKEEVKRQTIEDVINYIIKHENGSKIIVSAPITLRFERNLEQELQILLQKGFTRIVLNEEIHFIEEIISSPIIAKNPAVRILVDRITLEKENEDILFRLNDSVQTAFYEGLETCEISINGISRSFSDKFEMDGITFEQPSVSFFAFNNPYGACKTCEGFGSVLGVDIDLVIPNKSLSIYEGAIAPWRTEGMSEWSKPLLSNGIRFDFPIHRPYNELNEEQKNLLWEGNKYFKGLNDFFGFLQAQSFKIQYRVMLSRYRGRTVCPDCKGTRLRKDASYVKINGKSIQDIVLMPLSQAMQFFESIQLSELEYKVAQRLLKEICARISYLEQVGLGYLTLNRLTATLSGGEFQRIKLATSLGSALVGSMYVLDEPSIGLHPRDTKRLISVLHTLRDLGNTVIVVEHEEDVMRAADQIIDIGPDAGTAGGHLLFQSNVVNGELVLANWEACKSHTVDFLMKRVTVPLPTNRRKANGYIHVNGARENNLKNINVSIPLQVLTVVTGVSGSGKSTLIKKIIYPAIQKHLGSQADFTGKYESITGDLGEISQIEFIDQNPIGKSSRSNPVTYLKIYDHIRNLMSEQPLAQNRNYKPGQFSFNIEGGRCEACQGEGDIYIEMQFMADVKLKCEACNGKRFKSEILEIKYNDLDIFQILDLTVDDAILFFENQHKIVEKLIVLQEVGLGYIRLGQSSSTLSGGEAQRIKLASYLSKGANETAKGILFFFDEPTTGLHFYDILKLLKAINALVDQGNTVVIIEHNMEIVKCADWIIDLGPDGGENGGQLTFEGTPESMINYSETNITAQYLQDKFKIEN